MMFTKIPCLKDSIIANLYWHVVLIKSLQWKQNTRFALFRQGNTAMMPESLIFEGTNGNKKICMRDEENQSQAGPSEKFRREDIPFYETISTIGRQT